jgi:putative transposase
MRYRRARVSGGTFFFTLVTENRRPLFRDSPAVSLLMECIGKIRGRYPFQLDAYVVLPDHLHALWTLPNGDTNFSTRWRLIKEAFTGAYIKAYGAPFRSESREAKGEQGVWQRRFWEHAIRDEPDFERHLDYIHINPVHHGLSTTARDWPYSSFLQWVERGAYDPLWGSDVLREVPEWAKQHE